MKPRRRPVRVKLNPVAVWELLDQLGITQQELARRSGISEGYLSQLMHGRRSPSVRTQGRLQQALGVSDWDRLFSLNPLTPLNPPVSNSRSMAPLP